MNGDLPPAISDQKLNWQPCQAPDQQGFECAKLKVPLDYAKPESDTLDIAVIRATSTATDPSQRIGSLVFNYGGPGGPGVSALPGFIDDYGPLRERYDIVSFDPRGVGESSGVTCVDGPTQDRINNMDNSPDTPEEVDAFAAALKEYNAGCEKHTGELVSLVGTTYAARDLDVLREALGDRKFHYYGGSYGTKLGAVYAHLFPEHSGRLVLDAAVDPALDMMEHNKGQAAGMQRAFEQFVEAIVARCGTAPCQISAHFGLDRDKIMNGVSDLLDQLDQDPLPTKDPTRPLTQSLASTAVTGLLRGGENDWGQLDHAIGAALDGDGTELLAMADEDNGRKPDGSYEDSNAANTAIHCDDTTTRYSVDDIRDALPDFKAASPLFGAEDAWQALVCIDWPSKGSDASRKVDAPDADPILVAGTTHDPNTPYRWANKLVKALGNARLITFDGQGHSAYGKSPCIDEAINAYLLEGTLPAKTLTCKAEPPPAAPAPT